MSQSMHEEGQGDTGAIEPDSTAVETSTDESSSTSESINPIWASALEGIPDEFHSRLTPTFKEWDSNYAKEKERLAQFTPYQAFVESKVPPQDIDNALQLAQIYQNSPRDLYDYLQKQYNYVNEAPAVEEPEEEVFDLNGEKAFDLEKDPRFLQMQQETTFLRQAYEQSQNDRIASEMRSQVDAEVAQVKEQFPGLDIADVASMATGLAQANGQLPNLIEAAKHMSKYLPKERASDGAPMTLTGNSGLPATKTNFGTMSSDDRSAYIAERMRAMND